MENQQPAFYAIIPSNVRYDENLCANAKLLYGEITALCNATGYCWAKNDYFVQLYKVNERTISRWLKELESNGYITRELKYKEGTKEVESRYIRLSEVVTKMSGGGDKNVHTPGDKNVLDNNTSFNNTLNINTMSFIKDVLDYLNIKSGKNYRHTTKKNQDLIKARQKEGFGLEEFKTVIDKKCNEWLNTENDMYLRPETLFGTKFEGYLNQKEKVNTKNSIFNPWEVQENERRTNQNVIQYDSGQLQTTTFEVQSGRTTKLF